jgi:hypothetical protein
MRKLLLIAAAALCSAACTTTIAGSPQAASTPDQNGPAGLISQYFGELNVAGGKGPAAQRDFLQSTQHPDYTSSICDLGDLTLREQPAMSTLHEDDKWRPEDGTSRPKGKVYVVAVSVSVLRNGAALGEQIGLERLVLLNGKVYGFAPCPTG